MSIGLLFFVAAVSVDASQFECRLADGANNTSIMLAVESTRNRSTKFYYFGPIHRDFLKGEFGDLSSEEVQQIKGNMQFVRLKRKNKKNDSIRLNFIDRSRIMDISIDRNLASQGIGNFSYSQTTGYTSHVPMVDSGEGVCKLQNEAQSK